MYTYLADTIIWLAGWGAFCPLSLSGWADQITGVPDNGSAPHAVVIQTNWQITGSTAWEVAQMFLATVLQYCSWSLSVFTHRGRYSQSLVATRVVASATAWSGHLLLRGRATAWS